MRGQGQPHHNFYYNSLVMMTSNRGKQSISRGQIINSNASRGSAISIEYPFKANTSYEITLFTYFNDDVYAVDKVNSNGFPTVSVQLKDSPILLDNTDACGIENMIRITELNPNYIKSYVLENHIKESKTLKFNFSLQKLKELYK